jgi:hypothetical protein
MDFLCQQSLLLRATLLVLCSLFLSSVSFVQEGGAAYTSDVLLYNLQLTHILWMMLIYGTGIDSLVTTV